MERGSHHRAARKGRKKERLGQEHEKRTALRSKSRRKK
jgi:hypothetical protein